MFSLSRATRLATVLGLLWVAASSCRSAPPKGTVTARNKGVVLSLMLPGWEFVKFVEADRLYHYQKEKQQLYLAVSKYNRSDSQSPNEDQVKEVLLDLCPGRSCNPHQARPEHWVTSYATGTTQSVVHNWDVARLTDDGQMILSIIRLTDATDQGEHEVHRSIDASLRLELE